MSKLKQLLTTSLVYINPTTTLWVLRLYILSICLSVSSIQAQTNQTNIPSKSGYIELQTSSQDGTNDLTLYCWLGSKSCYMFESALTQWAADNALSLTHKPLIKRPTWRRLAKARLVAGILGQDEQVSQLIYQHLHQDNLPINSDEELFQLLDGIGVSANRFSNLYYAAETNQQINAIQTEAAQHQVRGIPSVVINNRWLIDATMHKTSRQIITTVEQLLASSES